MASKFNALISKKLHNSFKKFKGTCKYPVTGILYQLCVVKENIVLNCSFFTKRCKRMVNHCPSSKETSSIGYHVSYRQV